MSENLKLTEIQIDYLLSPLAVRERANKIFELTKEGKTAFIYHPEQLKPTINYVVDVIKKNYPDLKIPFHSRWGHFRVGQIDRAKNFSERLSGVDPLEKARSQLDLAITSVLLDAGAGPSWSFTEPESQKTFNRSEGLGVASFHMFCSGIMSSDNKSPRADAKGLKSVTVDDLKRFFQVSETNPLIGVEGRVGLLNSLGAVVENKTFFKDGRPGNILDYLIEKNGKVIPAKKILRAVLDGFGPIWPGRLTAGKVNLGDVWIYSKVSKPGSFESLVPFHKLSQWMTYSLMEPMMEAGIEIVDLHEMTGLAEYRNGGLFIDSGLLSLRMATMAKVELEPSSDAIIEWRALTIRLLDEIAPHVRLLLRKTEKDFPLVKMLEGGTWWAGRAIAKEKREGGLPPLKIKSDGTVF